MPKTREPAPTLPVARVLPLLGISHLDRAFDYRVDSDQDASAKPGVRVRIKFAGRLVDGIILDRTSESDHRGNLSWIHNVVSEEVVYPATMRKAIESLALRYAGVTSDLIRLAIPPRHAKAEESETSTPWDQLGEVSEPDLSSWSAYVHGEAFVDAVIECNQARAAWQIAPGDDWSLALASLAVKVVKDGGGALIVVPNQKDVDQLSVALRTMVSAKQVTELTASLGPQARYRRYLSIIHGQGRLVIGTRSAAFAPVENLKLMVIKDDGDENLVEQRAPYPHAREVLTTRAAMEKSSLIIAGSTRTAETQLLVESGWIHSLVAGREAIRARMPYIHAVADSDQALERDPLARVARIPSEAFRALRAGLDRGQPVILQVPRKGYVPSMACGVCRAPARCRQCNGPIGLPPAHNNEPVTPTCGWCGRLETHFNCPNCGNHRLRSVVIGAGRTAEEIGRAFSNTKVITSGGNKVIHEIPNEPSIVVATPGAEPLIEGGGKYGAAVLVDTWSLLTRADLRATEDVLAKWMHVSTLVNSGAKGGEVVIVADPSLRVVQHLIRWDPVGAAEAELADRREVRLPPAVAMAAIDGAAQSLDAFIDSADLPEHAEILGPVDLPPGVKLPGEYDDQEHGPAQRMLIRTPLGPRGQLGQALKAAQVRRATRKDTLPLRVQVDPIRVG